MLVAMLLLLIGLGSWPVSLVPPWQMGLQEVEFLSQKLMAMFREGIETRSWPAVV